MVVTQNQFKELLQEIEQSVSILAKIENDEKCSKSIVVTMRRQDD